MNITLNRIKYSKSLLAVLVVAFISSALLLTACQSNDDKVMNAIKGNVNVSQAVKSCNLSEKDWESLNSDTRKAVAEALFSQDITIESTWDDIEKFNELYRFKDSEIQDAFKLAGFKQCSIKDFSVERHSGEYLQQGEKVITNNDGSVSKVKTEELKEREDTASYKGYPLSMVSVDKVDNNDIADYYYYDLKDGVILADIAYRDVQMYSDSSSTIYFWNL